jgi:hypothetical protein
MALHRDFQKILPTVLDVLASDKIKVGMSKESIRPYIRGGQ